MDILVFCFCALLFGACVGSFLNVVIIRIPKEESLWRRMSHCVSCDTPIAAYDNIPILSYVILRGKCRHCGARFSAQYAIVELITALFFAVTCYFRLEGLVGHLVAGDVVTNDMVLQAVIPWLGDVSLLSLLLAMTWIDAEHFIIPLHITATGFIIGLALLLVWPPFRGVDTRFLAVAEAGKSLLAGAALLAVVRMVAGWVFKREALGLGDVHLMVMLAMFINWRETLLTIFLSAVLGSIGGIAAKFAQRRKHWRFEIPYGPYIAAAAVIAYFWGPRIIEWYWELALPR
ncbi:prepilin peptidase [bacterium]|nr:prepilin peptidase [bacterium]